MRLSRKKAIELCIEAWTWLAKTGKKKWEWPQWERYNRDILCYCWFCEYGIQRVKANKKSRDDKCDFCPYDKKYGRCYNYTSKNTYYERWRDAKTPRIRKKYAKLFLEQIRTLE